MCGIAILFWAYISYRQRYWQRLGIKSPAGMSLFFGHSMVRMKKRMSPFIQMDTYYNAFKGQKLPILGLYFITRPIALVMDVALLKHIFITDFDHFVDRGVYYNEIDDPVSAHLFSISGDTWRRLRAKVSPVFTSGKLRAMFPTIVSFAKYLDREMDRTVAAHPDGFHIRDITARFTTDVIGSCAFGIQCNSLENPDTEFRRMGDLAFRRQFWRAAKTNFCQTFPRFARLFRLRIVHPKVSAFYQKTVEDTVAFREREQYQRQDFMNLMIELKNSPKKESDRLTMKEIIGNSFIFFLAGFETSSATMMYTLYELAINQDVQDRARQQIADTMAKHNDELSFECLQEMDYLEKITNGEQVCDGCPDPP